MGNRRVAVLDRPVAGLWGAEDHILHWQVGT